MTAPASRADLPPSLRTVPLSALERRLSIGIVFAVCLAVFYLIAWNRGIALLYGLWAVMIIALLVSVLGPWLMLRPLRLRVHLPPQAAVGDEITVGLVAEHVRWPRRRTLVMLESLLPFSRQATLLLPELRADREYRSRVACTRRGVFSPEAAVARSAYPLGILSRRRTWDVRGDVIQIAPRTWPVHNLDRLLGQVSRGEDSTRVSSQAGQDVFRDTRDYRSGDSRRHIHWRSSARHDRLIVRQYDSVATPETLLLLNTSPSVHAGSDDRNSLEMAIELAASLARELLRQGMRCGLAAGLRASGQHDCWISPAAGDAQWRRLQQALTLLQPGAEFPYADFLQSLQGRWRAGQRWVLFDHEARPLVRPAFLAGAVEPVCFRFDMPGFSAGAGAAAGTQPLQSPRRMKNGWLIAADTDLAQVFR